VNQNRVIEFSLKIESEKYETLMHYFKISSVSSIPAPHTFAAEKTFKVPDLYLFPPGEGELNG
jgi:competence protein ComFB